MSAPVKPWERVGTNFQNSSPFPTTEMSGTLGSDSVASGPSPASRLSANPPQVPPRPNTQQSPLNSRLGTGMGYNNSYGGYGGGMGLGGYGGGMGLGGYGGGMYNSPYSSYGSSYGGYGNNGRMGDMQQTGFARHAEESSRPAFESIQSIVNAVNSVGMMLDSTFSAVYNSFRAVIGVADNFSRLKTQLVQVFSALAFIRTLRYICRRILELLRLRPSGEANRQWLDAFNSAAFAEVSSGSGGGAPKKSSWPIFMFFGIIMGGPYLIWKLISAFSTSAQEEEGWTNGSDDHFVARANHNFQGQGSEELAFTAGQTINIAPKEIQPRVRGWLLASVDGKTTGMIPANYVTVLGKRKGKKKSPLAQQPSLQQSDNSTSASQYNTTTMSQPYTTPSQLTSVSLDQELDSVFGASELPSSNEASITVASAGVEQYTQASCDRDASDILNDVDKIR